MQKIDFSKLLGFATVKTHEVDFSETTFGARVGAKVGGVESGTPASPSSGIDFQNETLGAKLGAKIGLPETL
jgi:hypothetical protein